MNKVTKKQFIEILQEKGIIVMNPSKLKLTTQTQYNVAFHYSGKLEYDSFPKTVISDKQGTGVE